MAYCKREFTKVKTEFTLCLKTFEMFEFNDEKLPINVVPHLKIKLQCY